jgi:hypothetical protein
VGSHRGLLRNKEAINHEVSGSTQVLVGHNPSEVIEGFKWVNRQESVTFSAVIRHEVHQMSARSGI